MSESYSSSSDTEDEVIEIGDESHDEPTSKRFFRPSGRTSGSTSATGRHSKKRKKISWVFDQFYEDDDITGRITCAVEGCGRSFSKGTSTTMLASHLTSKHSKNDGRLIAHNRLDDDKRARLFSKLVNWIVDNKQPIAVVENNFFKEFMHELNPFFHVPSRRTIGRGVDDAYEEAKAKIALVLEGYFVLTLHSVDKNWNLRSTVIEFIYFPPPHNQWTTSELLLSILKDLNLATRVRAVTTNSGGEMPPAMRHVAAKLNEEFDAKLESDWHVRCVCHIINRAVKDCETIVKLVVEKIRSLLKMICVSAVLRVAFREIQVLLGRRNIVDVPGLDVETRWNSMFEMIDNCFLVKDVFESMCNKEDFTAALGGLQLSQTDWREIKAVVNFLRPASELTTTASGSSYVTLSIQPLIYESLKTHCLSTISDTLEYGFTVPAAKRAAEAMLSKLEKYKENMNSPLCLLASDLDPSVPVPDIDIQELKFCIRQILIVRYGYQQQQNVEIPQRLGSCVERGQIDEVDDFFELTKRTDTSYDNVLEWWSTSNKRFPLLSRLARDTFMVMGSSVPLESAFSDSGSFVTSRRSSLSDENISKMMKLRSWNRLLKVLNK
ncbi:hypothetical protein Mp_2g08860 [Marchantia polymorpha subsp. ruderalis]|uniref:HAT C-terminal dimerisation domain-containing protein n=1 Tax=Marchantia polymorpha TaxID=3197 RepID=A0A2R6XGZ1_MARPO|nr:hypothetical protein MARPO_0015s0171 [Marchantia polymorpha]BBN01618.1 hypothetical protein Mp_2g08860 [Marchantia polymorpha subsp. ruderalis]|eukprot:PTQ45385.1 hypothetical protein MARPO_0015s0171 [Marchantia polymorpha]